METFNYGDRVTHRLHGNGKVYNVFPDVPAVQVIFDDEQYGQVVHPVSLTKVVVPKFEAVIHWSSGSVTYSGTLDKPSLRRYLSRLDEDMMDSYTVTKTA